MRRFFLAVLLSFLTGSVTAQQRWERNYGGTGDEYGYSVQQTQDGGYIVAGESNSFGNGSQVYLIKTNASGVPLWIRDYEELGDEYGYSVQQTQDEGYIVAGETYSFGYSSQVYLIKTNSLGDTLWTRNYGGAGSDRGYSVQQTTDGGYIITGYTSSSGGKVYLVKTNAIGDTLWTRTYGGAGYGEGRSVQQTSDGGYIVAGWIYFSGSDQFYLVKTNAFGDTLWTRNYGGMGNDWGRSVQQTSDTGYIVVGYGNYGQVYLIKTNASGDTLWSRSYGGTFGSSVRQTSDGGYIIAGQTYSSGNGYQVYLVKSNVSGDTLWARTYGGTSFEEGYSVQQTSDGGYIIAGYTSSFGNGYQVYLIKADSLGSSSGVEDQPSSRLTPYTSRVNVSPNPFTSFASVFGHASEHFTLYDISGRKVGIYRGDRIGEGLSAGVYFLRPEGKNSKPLRVVKVR